MWQLAVIDLRANENSPASICAWTLNVKFRGLLNRIILAREVRNSKNPENKNQNLQNFGEKNENLRTLKDRIANPS